VFRVKRLVCACLVSALACGFFFGMYHEGRTAEPQVIVQREPYYVYVEVNKPPEIVEVEVTVVKEVIKEVIVEKLVEVYKPLSDWDSLAELEAFLSQDTTDSHIYLIADENGVVKLTGNCEEVAFQLQGRAYEIGKRLDTEILTYAEYIKYCGTDGGMRINDGHYINKAVVGNEVWFVEPQSDKVWLAYYLD
jgi:hypothetical protein